ncbi:IS110 family transposase [Bradyrhizobium sp. KB893862 SZCCT0404]|uniref:IS110 family transposase n=1 Tax=Bradyrhizobium sp. KB893862 SZCCT0404 TaxID=2807672 RepID=UPI001BA66FD4|nr:IS110 family transposase [Bradyrhizobium sp. KB893862 SZCCT0404]MBR1180109.1 IS110 family transposase [Bradyrhizobium sp. KB893862 SZCCT0404]
MSKLMIGMDVAKGWIDIAVAGDVQVKRITNNERAIDAWLLRIGAGSIGLVAFEPTGGYERYLRRCLGRATVSFKQVHPNEVVAYRGRRGIRAKTDRIDARLLADFAAEELARREFAPAPQADEVLRELAARRRQLQALLHAETCRRDVVDSAIVRKSLQAVIVTLERSLAAVDKAIAEHIANSAHAETSRRLQTFCGAGPATAQTLIAELPELGHLSGKKIAALCGLAPHTRDSGKGRGHASTGHGRPDVRKVLFNGARSAIQHNPVMRAFYQRLVDDNHRPGKVALSAVMRKMLVTLNAMIRDGSDWKGAAKSAP